jgi:hypothetical protein
MRNSLFALLLAACACGGNNSDSNDTGPSPDSGADDTPATGDASADDGVTGAAADSDATSAPGVDTTAATAPGESSDGDSGASTGDAPPALPSCQFTCTAPVDCAQPGALYTPAHYTCDDGTCEWLGCMSDLECQDTYQSAAYRCGEVDGIAVPSCYPACDDVAQCFLPTPLYDNDNWACEDNRCAWLGCVDDIECQQTYQNASYVCADVGGPTPTCIGTCDAPADCLQPSPLYDGDNWACEDNRCEWLGCNTDRECANAFMNGNVVCEQP